MKNYIRITTAFLMVLALTLGNQPVIAAEPAYVEDRIGTSGTDPGEFDAPLDVLFAFDKYFVVERFNHRVQIFDQDWNYLDQFGGLGSGSGQFDNPFGLGANETHVFVADVGNDRISIHNPDGGYVNEFGDTGSGAGFLSNPTTIATHDDRIYIGEDGNSRIQIFNESTLEHIGYIGASGIDYASVGSPRDMVFVGDVMYAVDFLNETIKLYDLKSTNFLGYFGDDVGTIDQFQPYGLNYANQHFIVTAQESLAIFTRSGEFVKEIQPSFNLAVSPHTSDRYSYIPEGDGDVITKLKIVADPMDVTALRGDNGVSLSWDIHQEDGYTNPVSYNIYRDDGSGFEYIGETETKYFVDPAVGSNQSYTYQVQAVSIIGNSDKVTSNTVNMDGSVTVTETTTETVSNDQTDNDGSIFSSLDFNVVGLVPFLILVPILRKFNNTSHLSN